MIKLEPIPAFSDNYIWCLYDDQSLDAFVVDPGDAAPVTDWLEQSSLNLVGILITHHHPDHTGGLAKLLSVLDIPVYGPNNPKISQISNVVGDATKLSILGLEFRVIAVPGHTLDHIAYYNQAEDILFCGDTLFAGGCGRVFEGNPAMMLQSLNTLAALPPQTRVCCAHEYTMANLHFASAVESSNLALAERMKNDQLKRDKGCPTVPSTIEMELNTNPFLRCDYPAIHQSAKRQSGKTPADATETFAVIRAWKDSF